MTETKTADAIVRLLVTTRLSVKQITERLGVKPWRVYAIAKARGISLRRGIS